MVFLRPAGTVPESPFVLSWLGQERLRYTFDVIRLWEIPPEQVIQTPFYDLWPLAGLMAGVTADSTVEVAERIAAAPLPAKKRDELTRTLVTLAGMRIPMQALVKVLRRRHMSSDLDIWNESSLKDALVILAREEAARRSLRCVLEGRFGAVGEDVLAAMAQKDEVALDELALHAGTDTLEEFRARLGLDGPA